MPGKRRWAATAIFITATGSDVGQTFVTASLIRHLRQLGHQVDAVKPIVTGYDPAKAAATDPGILLSSLGFPLSPQEIDRISPWRFRAPVPPDIAAQREGRTIDVDSVVEYCQSALEQRREILLIEGVGGVMAPLNLHRTMLDVMMALELPLILVTGSYRGAISHTLTALDSVFRRDLNVFATIVSESPGSAIALDDVVAAIGRFSEPVISLPRPRHSGGDPTAALGRLFDPQGRRTQSSSSPQK